MFVLIGAANQDPRHFGRPRDFDLDREPSELRQHVGFGQGIHNCIGISLARLDLRIALELLLARLPDLRLVPDQPKLLAPGVVFNTPVRLGFVGRLI